MDNTLYPQILDVRQRVSACAQKFFPENSNEVENFWLKEWQNNEPKKNLIDIICNTFECRFDKEHIIHFYRSYKTNIQLQDEVANLLIKFKSLGIKQFVITNGIKEVQEYKIKKLELDKLIDDYAVGEGEYRKPNTYYFIKFLEKYKLNSFETFSVGDWYEVDGVASQSAGIEFIYLKGGPIVEEIPKNVRQIDTLLSLKGLMC
ncbi:MAG: HAD family hydrolase [Bacteroidia bacterium]|nr:HAD family hydrolase [Bacteroidia bacterium]